MKVKHQKKAKKTVVSFLTVLVSNCPRKLPDICPQQNHEKRIPGIRKTMKKWGQSETSPLSTKKAKPKKQKARTKTTIKIKKQQKTQQIQKQQSRKKQTTRTKQKTNSDEGRAF